MTVKVAQDGTTSHVYADEIKVDGHAFISRAAHVEPVDNKWYVYHKGKVVGGPFDRRKDAVAWEVRFVEENLL